MSLHASTWNNLPFIIDPIAFSIGFFSVRWYSLMIMLALVAVYALLRRRLKHDNLEKSSFIPGMLDRLFLFVVIGIFAGARLGYAILYDLGNTLENPLSVVFPFEGGSLTGFFGLSFHGGLVGAVVGGVVFCKISKASLFDVADFVVPAVPLGYFFGRIGNFLNGELFGRPTDSRIGMIFPNDPSMISRHPSQLYEAIGEGLLIFLILWPLRNNKKLRGLFLPLYLLLYGVVRFVLEFYRRPDPGLGFVLWNLSMGQMLSLGMIGTGIVIFMITVRKVKKI